MTTREAAELGGTTETTVKKAVDQRVIPTPRRGSQSCIDVDDVPVLAMPGLLSEMRLAGRQKRQLREWLRQSSAPKELELTRALVVRRVDEIEQVRLRGCPAALVAIVRAMAEDGEIGKVWSLRRPRAYYAIETLTRVGFARPARTVASRSGPHRTVLRITPSGRRAIADWLATPVEHVRVRARCCC